MTPHACLKCGKTFASAEAVMQHTRAVHEAKKRMRELQRQIDAERSEDNLLWRAMRARSRAVRKERVATAPPAALARLAALGIPHRTGDNGVHIQITLPGIRVDFWPTTGRWHANNDPGRGTIWEYLERHKGAQNAD